MKSSTGNSIVWLSVFGLILVLSAGVWSAILTATDGRFAYILDDPYIHLAIARNLAESGVWGVTRYEFTGASSSIVWIGLLTLIEYFFGRAELAPLFLNMILAGIFTAMVQRRLQEFHSSRMKILGLSLLILLSTPVITLVFLGMEHLLQTVIAFAFVYAAARHIAQASGNEGSTGDLIPAGDASAISENAETTAITVGAGGGALATETANSEPNVHSEGILKLAVLALLTTSVRYEGLFQIAAVGLYLVLRRRFVAAAAIGAAGAFVPAMYALYSNSQGWPALPTPLLMKGSLSGLLNVDSMDDVLRGVNYLIQEKYIKHIHMPILLALTGFAYLRNRRRGASPFSFEQILLGLFLLIAIQHVHLAGLGWYFRYEAYLVALGLVLLAMHYYQASTRAGVASGSTASRTKGWRRVLIAAVVIACVARLCFSLGWRAFVSVAGLPGSAREIYTQQIQSARFFDRYYSGQAVAANDIGAINYFADIRCVDLFGLANHEVARLRKNDAFTTESIAELSERAGVRVAIVYDKWFERAGGLPAHWRKAGEWTIPERTTVAQDTVAIYAVDADYNTLVQQLIEFGESMPAEIEQNVPYRAQKNPAIETAGVTRN